MTSAEQEIGQSEPRSFHLNRRIKTVEAMSNKNQLTQSVYNHPLISKNNIFIGNPSFIFNDDNTNNQQMVYLHETQASRIHTNREMEGEDDVMRMKLMFESRLNNKRRDGRSVERSQVSKSSEKHMLRPTNVPSFNKSLMINGGKNSGEQQWHLNKLQRPKLQRPKRIVSGTEMNNSFEITQMIVRQSENGTSSLGSQMRKDHNGYMGMQGVDSFRQGQKGSTMNHQQVQKGSKIYERDQVKQRADRKDNKYRFQDKYSQSFSKDEVYPNCQTLRSSEQITPLKQNFISQDKRLTRELSAISIERTNPCGCQMMLKNFMQQTNNKMAEITERLMMLQNQNARLRKMEQKFNETSRLLEEYRNQAESMQAECNQLKQSNYSCQAEKEQLELLLKEILFKRQKEKYQRTSASLSSSKQNTQRYETDSKERVKSVSQEDDFVQFEGFNEKRADMTLKRDGLYVVKKPVQPLGVKVNNFQKQNRIDKNFDRQTDPKSKVQSLLNKIQIKIQKS